MHKFEFRLAKVLAVREAQEQESKELFRTAHQATLAMENEIEAIDQQIAKLIFSPLQTLDERIEADTQVLILKEERTSQLAALSILEQEEERALTKWTESKKETEAVRKLKENALREYREEVIKFEQKQLDEWASTQRKAA